MTREEKSSSHGLMGSASAVVAHDLRNVLSCIRGHARLLLSGSEEGGTVEHAAVIEAESTKCCELIERVLRPARSAGDADPRADTGRAVRRVRDLAHGEAALAGVFLIWQTEDGLCSAAIPQDDIEQVLLNLVRNGIRAAPRGGCVHVRARACRLDDGAPGVEIAVSDTGRGLPKDALGMLFEPCYSTRGVGLGLAICSSRVKRCGGSIEVGSKEGAGTTFTVRLPARA